ENDVPAILKEIDSLVSREAVSAKEVSDAAVALTYLQVKANRRLWGKVLEKAGAAQDYDAASLTNLLWAINTGGVEHFKTVAELAGPAVSLLPSLSPVQLSIVVEALGGAGVKNYELYNKASAVVVSKIGEFKPAEIARVLYGVAFGGVNDVALAKAAGKVFASTEVDSRTAAQALYALAKLGRADKATVDALLKSFKKGTESASDAAAASFALGSLSFKAEKAIVDALKASAGDLAPAQAVEAAYGLALSGATDAEAFKALFGVVAPAIEKAPDALEVSSLAQLHVASTISGAKLPAAVGSFVAKAFGLAADAARLKRSSAESALVADVAAATAVAFGAQYRPEVASAVASYVKTAPDGSVLDIAITKGDAKVLVQAVPSSLLTSTTPAKPLGHVAAYSKVREAQGYAVAVVPANEFEALPDQKAKAQYVLAAIKKVAPSF
uniref:Mitochondrial ATP synthase subunit ASA2 n=1 Tax=Polytomella sp. Pringsheim 198.80 TaxID=37502 RepID=UPI0011329F78|nr:Chain 2, Mitochondrial ATP synthase subunit ASA2 [Polytomella sp. Pringsheim 198.80]6RD6_2 Chain 2, ASA-2: Polytomella F-ATP synthase associated subunit 2 [Polytomella sp. Pringsheim 198.80]6RD9_2 Chain 2, ASA-2: Polytomella F-ATP synthase associated subunit 2 [Polytomella sp. Pringsheim 198.80]6RDA_2 Chain 2, ASA-2: Polytomella F-ATP synthase associated subunit 2 [Polytomella sp. Pringsheim 198.80]6RDC_2 Chain 2, ASA-2: Polytomella F-ATP synthase associated subunit 2 [Polytomella sp. Prings